MAFYGFVAGRVHDGGHVDTVNAWFHVWRLLSRLNGHTDGNNPVFLMPGERQEPRTGYNVTVRIFYRWFALALVYRFSVGEA